MCMMQDCTCALVKNYDQMLNSYGTTIVYVDSNNSICSQTTGFYARNCEERIEKGPGYSTIIYRCVFCHRSDFDHYCKGTTVTGKACKSAGNYNGYCRKHSDQGYGVTNLFSIDQLEGWLSAYERRTVAQWKIKLRDKLQEIERIADMQLKALLGQVPPTYVYFIECDGYVKIGRSKKPNLRFKTLVSKGDTTLKPSGINMANAKLLGTIAGSEDLESKFHWMLSSHRVEGEWFKYNSHLAKVIKYALDTDSEFTLAGVYALLDEENAEVIKQSEELLGNPLYKNLTEPDLEAELNSVIPWEEKKPAKYHYR